MRVDRREQMREDGVYCSWEAEQLTYAGRPLWVEEPPMGEDWCRTPGESSRTVDVLGQDGPFLSLVRRAWSCCPDRTEASCGTVDVRDGHAITLEEYDERHAAKRWEKAIDKAPPGVVLDRDDFLVGDGHVGFCVAQADGLVEVRVR